MKCNHDLNSKDNSLDLLSELVTMVAPRKYYTVCRCCDKDFVFIKGEEGRFVLASKEVYDNADV